MVLGNLFDPHLDHRHAITPHHGRLVLRTSGGGGGGDGVLNGWLGGAALGARTLLTLRICWFLTSRSCS
jgi:hypothetical protein